MPFTFSIPRKRDHSKRGECRVSWTYYYSSQRISGKCTFKNGDTIKVPCDYWNTYKGKLGKREMAGRVNTSFSRSKLINTRLDYLDDIATWILDNAREEGFTPDVNYFRSAWDRQFAESEVFKCFDDYVKHKKKDGIGKNMLDNYHKLKVHLKRYSKDLSFRDFKFNFPLLYGAAFPDLAQSSITHDLRNLKAFLRYGVNIKWHTNRDYEGWKLKAIQGRKTHLEPDEVRRIIDANLQGSEARVRDVFVFLIFSGLRWNEAAKLDEVPSESQFTRHFRYKVSKQRGTEKHITFELRPGYCLDIWDKYKGALPYVRNRKGDIANPGYFNEVLKRLSKRVGIEKNLHAHVARHTFTTLILSHKDATKTDVQDQTGQTSKVVDNYDHSVRISTTPSMIEDMFRKAQ